MTIFDTMRDIELGELNRKFEELDHLITTNVEEQGLPTADLSDALDAIWDQVIPIEKRRDLASKGLLQRAETDES